MTLPSTNGGSTPLHLHCSLSASRQRTRVRCELCQKQRVPFPTISNKEAIIELPSRLQLSNATTASYEDRPMGSERQGRLPQHSVTLPSHVALLPIHRFGRCPPTQTPVQARCSGTHSLLSGCPEVRYACGPRRTSSTKQNHSSHTLPHAVRRE